MKDIKIRSRETQKIKREKDKNKKRIQVWSLDNTILIRGK